MKANLPYGGSEIAALRASRKRPADMVLVSLIGPLREPNPLVMARPEKSYDWRFLAGLDVLLVAATTIDSRLVKRAVEAILSVRPEYLGVWFSDRQDGLNLAFGCWKPKSKAIRMMGFATRRDFAGIGK